VEHVDPCFGSDLVVRAALQFYGVPYRAVRLLQRGGDTVRSWLPVGPVGLEPTTRGLKSLAARPNHAVCSVTGG